MKAPVFGLAGIILPELAIRPFATKFLQLKQFLFQREINQSRKLASHWEKKGTEIFTHKTIARYPHFRSTGFRLFNYVKNCRGHIFYYGREKIYGTTNVNSTGLYTTVLSHTIRQLENYAEITRNNYIIVTDEHSARKELLITASKTMFGSDPAHHLLSPPFEVESYINQNIQAADWIASIIGRLWAYELLPTQYPDHKSFKYYFHQRLQGVSTHSTVFRRWQP